MSFFQLVWALGTFRRLKTSPTCSHCHLSPVRRQLFCAHMPATLFNIIRRVYWHCQHGIFYFLLMLRNEYESSMWTIKLDSLKMGKWCGCVIVGFAKIWLSKNCCSYLLCKYAPPCIENLFPLFPFAVLVWRPFLGSKGYNVIACTSIPGYQELAQSVLLNKRIHIH